MRLIHRENSKASENEIVTAIMRGDLFVYPTDTIYGFGCDASNEISVQKIRDLKKRDPANPLSVIAPSKDWIMENCIVDDERLLEKLPGPYTLIFKLKNKSAVARNINNKDDSLGVRMIKHWFQQYIEKAGLPFVTTSVNTSGGKYMQAFKDIPEEMEGSIDYVIYEGEHKGVPSEKLDYAHAQLPNISNRKPPE